MKRRNFLAFVASLLPTAVVANRVTKQKGTIVPTVPKAPQAAVARVNRSSIKLDRMVKNPVKFFCDCPAEQGMVAELANYHPNPQGGHYAVVRPGPRSGQPIGVLLQDVVQPKWNHPGWMDNKVDVGGVVTLLQQGTITAGVFDNDVSLGAIIYYDNAGRMTTENTGRPIGIAMSKPDCDGYVKVSINLYINESASIA